MNIFTFIRRKRTALTALLLTLAMLFSLAACGAKADPPSSPESTPAAEEPTQEESPQEEPVQESPEQDAPSQEEPEQTEAPPEPRSFSADEVRMFEYLLGIIAQLDINYGKNFSGTPLNTDELVYCFVMRTLGSGMENYWGYDSTQVSEDGCSISCPLENVQQVVRSIVGRDFHPTPCYPEDYAGLVCEGDQVTSVRGDESFYLSLLSIEQLASDRILAHCIWSDWFDDDPYEYDRYYCDFQLQENSDSPIGWTVLSADYAQTDDPFVDKDPEAMTSVLPGEEPPAASADSDAPAETGSFASYAAAYADVLRSVSSGSEPEFVLAYVDSDDVPELVVFTGGSHADCSILYLWQDGQAVESVHTGPYGTFCFQPRKGIICSSDVRQGNYTDYERKLENGVVTDMVCMVSDAGNLEDEENATCYIDGEIVSYEVYMEAQQAYMADMDLCSTVCWGDNAFPCTEDNLSRLAENPDAFIVF